MYALTVSKVLLLLSLYEPLGEAFHPSFSHTQLKSCSHTQLYAVKTKNIGSSLPDLSQKIFPTPPKGGYDLIVVGSGPGGESIAVTAAQLGAKVAVIEKRSTFGGPTGLTSKAVREAARRICKAVDQVGGDRRKQIRGLWRRRFPLLKSEAEVLQAAETRDKLRKNQVDLYVGEASISNKLSSTDANDGSTVLHVSRGSSAVVELPSTHVCIATGSRPNRPSHLRSGAAVPFTKGRVVDATEVGNLPELPNAVVIIGGGVIAVEYGKCWSHVVIAVKK
jgi:pyruvate/2-oxoglutarate dehydrogenase complex dihydrolipoamide dehydrogenase (E3) component